MSPPLSAPPSGLSPQSRLVLLHCFTTAFISLYSSKLTLQGFPHPGGPEGITLHLSEHDVSGVEVVLEGFGLHL